MTRPTEAGCSRGEASVRAFVDGRYLGVGGLEIGLNRGTEPTETIPMAWRLGSGIDGSFSYEGGVRVGDGPSGWLYEPGSPTTHTLTVLANDSCEGGVHFTINSVSIDVIGVQ